MRLHRHPKLKDKSDKWKHVALVTGKWKASDWSPKDRKILSSLIVGMDDNENRMSFVNKLLSVLYKFHSDTWKRLIFFSRGNPDDLPSCFKKAVDNIFCSYCGNAFSRNFVCQPCKAKSSEARELNKKLGYQKSSQTWHSKPEEVRALKGKKIAATRANWSPEQKAASKANWIAASASIDWVKVQKKRASTYKKRTGYENPSQDPEVQATKRARQKERYGVEHPSQRKEVAKKISAAWQAKPKEEIEERTLKSRQTSKARTGFEHNMLDPEHRSAREDAYEARTGYRNPRSNPDVRETMRDTWEAKYGYREILQSPLIRKKVLATLQARYGVDNPSHYQPFLVSIQEKRKKPVEYKGQTYFVDSSLEADAFVRMKDLGYVVRTQYDKSYPKDRGLKWLPDFYLPKVDKFVEIKGLYTLWQAPGVLEKNREKARSTPNCRWLVRGESRWIQLPANWHELTAVALSRLIAEKTHRTKDFTRQIYKFFKALKLKPSIDLEKNLVTVNGTSVFCACISAHNSDRVKSRFIKEQGADIVLWDYQWETRRTAVKKFLSHKVCSPKFRVDARETSLETSKLLEQDRKFFDANHIQGAPKNGLCYKLIYKNQIVALMSFSRILSVRGTKSVDGFELTRFATLGSVPGAGSRLLTAFIREHRPKKIISYSDTQHFNGDLYTKLGFVKDRIGEPDYKTVWSMADYLVLGKQSSSRKNLKAYAEFMPEESEARNLKNMDIPKIYDCGKIRWVLKLES